MDIKEIKQQIKISDVIKSIVNLTETSKDKFIGLCPFHKDTTPSLQVNDNLGVFHCFSCSAGGDIFKFYEKYYHIQFKDALKKIKDDFGFSNLSVSNSTVEEEVSSLAMRLFIDNSQDRCAKEYSTILGKRNISKEIAKLFHLGIAGKSNQITSYIKSFKDKEKSKLWIEKAVSLGLVRQGKDGQHYDAFKNRLIFPIFNKYNKVVGFSGYRLSADKRYPKYLNSTSSVLFDKKKVVFGENLLTPNKSNILFIVEGLVDVIAMHSNGFDNTIGLMGLNITQRKVDELQQKFRTIYLVLDNDEAGREAMKKISLLFLQNLYLPKFIEISPYKDPDDFFKEQTSSVFLDRILKAAPIVKVRS